MIKVSALILVCLISFKDNQDLVNFWRNLKEGFDIFELTCYLPEVIVDRNGRYMFIQDDFGQMVFELKSAFPRHFLDDAIIAESNDIVRPMVFGEPDPPEGFAGPDPTGKHSFGIYVPVNRDNLFKKDISLEQWIFHEMFHLHNRRTKKYEPYINKAFPDENDPLVQWIKKDPYHKTFAREEAFINLITFADPTRTKAQNEAVREWFDYVGAKDKSLEEIKKILNIIKHW